MSDQVPHFIGGGPVAEGATFVTYDPVTGRPVRTVHEADPAVGREGGTHSLDFYSEPTTITITLEPGDD